MSSFIGTASRAVVAALSLTIISAGEPVAQTEGAALRYPAEGLPILDCDPASPMPADSCVLRVPPSLKRGKIEKKELDEAKAAFNFTNQSNNLPAGIVLSRSMVLVDLSPGVNGARKPSWARERAMIAKMLRALPQDDQVALYGFNETLERLSDFTTDHDALARQVEALDLRGANTRIATNVRDAVELLGAQNDAIVKSVIVVSDGREEGERDPAEVARTAIDKGVTISGLAMLWGPIGAPENGAGMDYLQLLTEGTLGETRSIQLRGTEAEDDHLATFIEGLRAAHGSSGLILPEGDPVAADITVVMQRPIPGQPGQFSDEQARARFIPAAERHGQPPAPNAEKTAWLDRNWLGIGMIWWLVGALAAALFLGLAIALLSRRKADLQPDDINWDEGDAGLPVAAAPPTPATPLGPPLAYLLREDDGSRVTIRAPRVTIGRSSNCDIEIGDGSISRLHAELVQRPDGGFQLSDAGSLNGTLLNGRKLDGSLPIKPGDILTLGKVRLRFSQA